MKIAKKLSVTVMLGIVLLQASPAALPIPCIFCTGSEPDDICIPPGCTPPALLDLDWVPRPWASSGTLADRPGNGGAGR